MHMCTHTLEVRDRKDDEENLTRRGTERYWWGAEDRGTGTPVVCEGRVVGKKRGTLKYTVVWISVPFVVFEKCRYRIRMILIFFGCTIQLAEP